MKLSKKEFIERILADRSVCLPHSDFDKIMQMAAEGKDIISLGPGEPDFVTPKHIIQGAKKFLDQGFTHYSAPQGRKELRELIARKARKENKINCSAENVIVTAGSTEAIILSLMDIADKGEEVLVPNPGFLAYYPTVEVIDAKPVCYNLKEETGFQIDLDELKKKISPKTRVLLINSPGNPTGTVFSKKVLEEIAGIAIEKELMILSDEAYEKLVYDNAKHISIASLNGLHDRVVTLQSFSKTFAMAGFRIGYAIAPEWLVKSMSHLHLYSTICAPTISQKAAEVALTSSQKPTQKMVKEYARRRKMILKRLSEIPALHVKVKPEGAFYAFPRIHFNKMNSCQFSHFLLEKARVLTVPGTEFGTQGEGFIRMSYATDYNLIEKAMDRIEKVLK